MLQKTLSSVENDDNERNWDKKALMSHKQHRHNHSLLGKQIKTHLLLTRMKQIENQTKDVGVYSKRNWKYQSIKHSTV